MGELRKAKHPAQADDRKNLAAKVRQPLQRRRRQRHSHHVRNTDDFLHRHHVGGEDLIARHERDKLLGTLLSTLLSTVLLTLLGLGGALIGRILPAVHFPCHPIQLYVEGAVFRDGLQIRRASSTATAFL